VRPVPPDSLTAWTLRTGQRLTLCAAGANLGRAGDWDTPVGEREL